MSSAAACGPSISSTSDFTNELRVATERNFVAVELHRSAGTTATVINNGEGEIEVCVAEGYDRCGTITPGTTRDDTPIVAGGAHVRLEIATSAGGIMLTIRYRGAAPAGGSPRPHGKRSTN